MTDPFVTLGRHITDAQWHASMLERLTARNDTPANRSAKADAARENLRDALALLDEISPPPARVLPFRRAAR